MSDEVAFAGVAEQARMIRSGEITPPELLELYLDRIASIDPKLNAFRVVYADQARDAALAAAKEVADRSADDLARDRPFLGVPVAVKDTVDIEGDVTMLGTDAFDEPAAADSSMATLLREAGAIIVGKTHLPELAICGFTESATWGVTRNPWNLQRSPGGSSGGSAAAVAAGLVPVASASDGAGSIRLPASSCGLFGLKPQRGRVAAGPGAPHWTGMSVNGCISRTVLDTAMWIDATLATKVGETGAPPDPERPYSEIAAESPGKLRIAWSLNPPRAIFPPELYGSARDAVSESAELMRNLGHEVAERDPDWGNVGNNVMPRYLKGIAADIAEVPYPDRLERRTRQFGMLGRAIPQAILDRALRQEGPDGARIGAIFHEFDVIMTPVMAGTAVPVRNWEGMSAARTIFGMSRYYPYCVMWNHLGNPAASVPAGFASDGMPRAVQLIGRENDEATLLRLAAQLEAERPWADAIPDSPATKS